MKKSAVKLLSLFFAMSLFVACNNAPKATDEAEETPAVENVEAPATEVIDTVTVEVDTTVVEAVVEEIVE